jgi:hypothetical protein
VLQSRSSQGVFPEARREEKGGREKKIVMSVESRREMTQTKFVSTASSGKDCLNSPLTACSKREGRRVIS